MSRERDRRWQVTAAAVFVAAGVLFAASSLSSKGLDLRATSITDLDHVVRAERQRSDSLQARVAALNKEIGTLSHQVSNRDVTRLQHLVDALRQPAGFQSVAGPGLTVVLTDAPKSEIDKATQPGGVTPDELVVHQQDIQAVANALWFGGAEAMTIQNQRVISTTGIKCVGNTVILHGVPYSPPYVIAAIGDPARLQAALDASEYIQSYRIIAETHKLGYQVTSSVRLQFPAYTGITALKYAVAEIPQQPSRG